MFKVSAYKVYLFIVGMRSLAAALAFTIFPLYLLRVVGVNPLELVLPGTAYESTIFLFEIPTGVVADVYSRRLSIIIGIILLGLGTLVASSIPLLAVFILGMVIAGFGSTFISGALSAWIVDEVGQEQASQAFMRGAQVAPICGLVGIVLTVIIGNISMQLAIAVAGILLTILGIILLFIMPETGFQRVPTEQRETWADLFKTFRDGVKYIRLRVVFFWIFVVTFVFGGFGEGFGRMWAALVLEHFTLPPIGAFGEVIWFGIISAGVIPLTLIATEVVRRRVNLADSDKVVRTLLIVYSGMIVSVLMVAWSQTFMLVLIGLWLTRMLISVARPLMEAWINQHITSNVRATILSVNGQFNSFGEIIGGPAIGIIATLTTVRIAISFTVVLIGILLTVVNRVPHSVKESPVKAGG